MEIGLEEKVKKLKREIFLEVQEIAKKYVDLINSNGGEARTTEFLDYLTIEVRKQPSFLPEKYFDMSVRLTSIRIEEFDLPAISTTGSTYTLIGASEYKDQLDKCFEILSESGDISKLISKIEEYKELKNSLRENKLQSLAEEFKSLPPEETLWEKENIVVIKRREYYGTRRSGLDIGIEVIVIKNGEAHNLWLGDYIGIDTYEDMAIIAWTDTRSGKGEIWGAIKKTTKFIIKLKPFASQFQTLFP